jgi:hypothetical protein
MVQGVTNLFEGHEKKPMITKPLESDFLNVRSPAVLPYVSWKM